MNYRLLAADEPHPVLEHRRIGLSDFVLIVDHASRRVPRRLGDLGLPPAELERHIAWDIGALGVARRLSDALDAALVAQNYSRLVIDCNRDPRTSSSIPAMSESTEIPGNVGLQAEEAEARHTEIFAPYHGHIRALLDERARAARRTVIVALHSMTGVFKGSRREMHGAVLSNRDRRLADPLLEALRSESGLIVGDNEPYSGSADYTIPRHAEARGLPHVEIEMRQDLICEEAGQMEWAERLARALRRADELFSRAHELQGINRA